MVEYINPIIPGFNPDPSCCLDPRTKTYYLVTSSFLFFPGIPVYASKDPRKGWKHVSNIISRVGQLSLLDCTIDPPGCQGGVWAPTIRFNPKDERFYVSVANVFPDIPNGDPKKWENVIFHTQDPAGEWSDPVHFELNGFDTSLFFDFSPTGKGECYVQGTSFASIGWDDGFKPEILQYQIDPLTGKQLGETKAIWSGHGGWAPEAPHMYWKDGYWYLLLAERGTELGHCATMARSKDLWGPFEGAPLNPLLRSPTTVTVDPSHPSYINCTGHADLFPSLDGDDKWWAVCLGIRDAIDSFPMGRETHLLPVEWKAGDFPIWNNAQHVTVKTTAGSASLIDEKVSHNGIQKLSNGESESINFGSGDAKSLPVNLLFCREPALENYNFNGNEVALIGNEKLPSTRKGQFTFLGRRQTDISFELSFALSFHPPEKSSDEAGLLVYLDCDRYIPYKLISSSSSLNRLSPSHISSSKSRTVRLGDDMELCNDASNLRPPLAKKLDEGENEWVELKVVGKRRWYEFYYKARGGEWVHSGNAMARRVSGGFTGVIVGAYATGNGRKSETVAKIKDFKYTSSETH